MGSENDFEKDWISRITKNIKKHSNDDLRKKFIHNINNITDSSPKIEVICWTNEILGNL
jgi:hypothetical protein